MPLSWNEIRHNAIRFAKEWAGETREEAEAKSFWDEFFQVFGTRRRLYATFEEPVKNLGGDYSYIDLFWRGVLIVEHKSFGKNLSKAESQAQRYIQDLAREGREQEIPRYLIVSDFARIALHDMEEGESVTFPLADLHQHIYAFAFIPGYQRHKFKEEDPANIKAAEILGELHDALEAGGFSGHDLERFLVRILFCLFAEDTGLFPRRAFELYLEENAFADMANIGTSLEHLFQVLNTPEDKRQKHLSAELAQFPYVNGELFAERLQWPEFGDAARQALRQCCGFDWSRISPAIFGSLFQAVMEPRERRQIGGHYTAEHNILKVIRSLFLDALRAEFDAIQADRSTRRRARLEELHAKLCALKFLDPACGCGNFLVITYRELRRLELEVLRELFGKQRELTLADINRLSQVDVDQFYGIEIGEWPVRIAEVALWLMDHQMNLAVSEAFGQLYQRLPLKKSPHIVCANALRMDWKEFLSPGQCSYILGNPPFVGKHYQTKEQRADLVRVFRDFKNTGDIDYVTAWFYRAAQYIQGTRIKVGFVSTNSITQGEQVPIVWGLLFGQFRIKIHFAHRTFAWESEARGKAHVHVVIIGFAVFDTTDKQIYDYEGDKVSAISAANISPYLTPGSDAFVTKRTKPLADVPEMRCGNKPTDDGNLILTDEERAELLQAEPGARKFLRRFTGSEEFINGNMRWCLWLVDANPAELRALPKVMERVQRVREFRAKSTAAPTQKAAKTPTLFFFISQPRAKFIAIPEVSSERRRYIPIGFLEPEVIVSNKIYLIASPNFYLFGVLSSAMHMAWVRQVCGRLKSDFQYSGSMVYNNYPWPESVTAKQRAAVEQAAQRVLDGRAEFLAPGARLCEPQPLAAAPRGTTPGASSSEPAAGHRPALPAKTATLADLYDPLSMPPKLQQAHEALDRAVDKCYRPEPFTSERQRVEFLFALYEKLTAPMAAAMAAKPKPKRSSTPPPP